MQEKKTLFLLFTFLATCNILLSQIKDSVKTGVNDIVLAKNGVYDVIKLTNGINSTLALGAPDLPFKVFNFVIPFNAIVKNITVTGSVKTPVSPTFNIYPAQLPFSANQDLIPSFIPPDSVIYNSSAPYPGKLAEIISDGYEMGFHILSVRFYPLEYIPAQHILNIFTCIRFEIEYSGAANKVMLPLKISENRYNESVNYIQGMVKNPSFINIYGGGGYEIISNSNNLTPYVIDTATSSSMLKSLSVTGDLLPDYIIITADSLKSVFQALASWKIQKGVPAVIVTVEDIYANFSGLDNVEKIRNYLKNMYNQCGSGLYVLLGGGIQVVPSRIVTGYNNIQNPFDLYYSDLAGTSLEDGEVILNFSCNYCMNNRYSYLGRLPVNNAADAATVINKIISYEKLSNTAGYVNNFLFLGADLSTYSNSTVPFINMATHALPSNIKIFRLYDEHLQYVSNDSLYGTNVIRALNGGYNEGSNPQGPGYFSFIYHMDHSSAYALGTSALDNGSHIFLEDLQNLTNLVNGPYHQIFFSEMANWQLLTGIA